MASLTAVKRILPQSLKRFMPRRYPAYCPVCGGRHSEFWPFNERQPRPNALCPQCQSLERHRLLWLFIERHLNVHGKRLGVLHFAPEPGFGGRLARAPWVRSYVSLDLAAGRRPSVLGDITGLPFADGAFDAAICSHVLEHISDDRAAMRECRRVIDPNGWLAVQVPIRGSSTDEDLTVVDPKARERRFGQSDHVRTYGLDIVDRLTTAGFVVSTFSHDRVLTPRDRNVGIPATEPPVFLCRPQPRRSAP